MSTPETVPVPVELLRRVAYETGDAQLEALLPGPSVKDEAIEAIAETMRRTAVVPNMPLIDRTARAALAALLDLGWTPPEET